MALTYGGISSTTSYQREMKYRWTKPVFSARVAAGGTRMVFGINNFNIKYPSFMSGIKVGFSTILEQHKLGEGMLEEINTIQNR